MDRESFRRALRAQVYPITRGLFQGPFATGTRADDLLAAGVSHVLNVGEVASVLPAGLFREVAWRPVVDLERVPDDVARDCLDCLHRMLAEPDSRVYVHCVAGWNRSPTVVWLYLVACGLDPIEAKQASGRRSLNAIPAHPKLVDEQLVRLAQEHGRSRYLPHPRPEALEWSETLS
jgi:hypothetical protein